MGRFLPDATIITGYKLATSFLKDTMYFCAFLKRQGIFSFSNGHVMAVSVGEEKKEKKKNPIQFQASHEQKRQGCFPQSQPGCFLLPKHVQFLIQADLEHESSDTFPAPEN